MEIQDWKSYYSDHKMTADEAVKLIRSGDRVVNSHLGGAPLPVIDAMVKNYQAYEDVEITCMLTSDGIPYAEEQYKGHFRMNPWFVSGNSAKALAAGFGDMTPSHFSEIPGLLRTSMKPDVALIQVCPPDEHGYVSLGISTDYMIGAVHLARTVIAEVNAQCPRVFGDAIVHVSEIDAFVESDRPIVPAPVTKITDVERAIGGYCAELIEDGSCMQIGIGAIPDAVLGFLESKKDLGIHSEIIGDGVKHLCDLGVINGRRKEIDTGKVVCTSYYGTDALYKLVNNNPIFQLRAVDYTNDPRIICKNSRVVSINSCVEVDLTGQVCSEAVGARQISGIGGQVDFIRGAKMSPGGKSIIACYSTAKGGAISKIVPALKPGTPVTTSRTDVDYIITEYGIAQMRGRSLKERAKALIAVAHPNFREELKEQYQAIYGWGF